MYAIFLTWDTVKKQTNLDGRMTKMLDGPLVQEKYARTSFPTLAASLS